MGTLAIILWGLAVVCGLVGFVFFIIILVHAFKVDTGQGFLCLCVPFYILYFAIAKFEHPKKIPIIAVWLGAYVLQGFLIWGAAAAALSAAGSALQNYAAEHPAGSFTATYPTTGTVPGTAPGAIPVAPLPGTLPGTIPTIPTTPTPGAPGAPPPSPLVPVAP